MFNFGIVGYQPLWLRGHEAVAAAHGPQLNALTGRVLQHVWLVWDLEADEWFADCPVLLDFGDEHVLVNHRKFDDLSVTFGIVDISLPVMWGRSDRRLSWRAEPLSPLGALAGNRVRSLELLEYMGDDLANGTLAVSLTFTTGQLLIFNALDENGLAFDSPGTNFRRHPLSD